MNPTSTNLSILNDDATARTCPEAAEHRARCLSMYGVKSVLELCVGPSLCVLEEAYRLQGIHCTGNDIDPRWRSYYPRGNWVMGDALKVELKHWVDAVVFAPPLSVGCTGRREDSLRLDEVRPRYLDFLERWHATGNDGPRVCVLVLPARVYATRQDRTEYHNMFAKAWNKAPQVCGSPVLVGRRGIRKYVELTLIRNNS